MAQGMIKEYRASPCILIYVFITSKNKIPDKKDNIKQNYKKYVELKVSEKIILGNSEAKNQCEK